MPRGWGASSHPKSEGGGSEPQASGETCFRRLRVAGRLGKFGFEDADDVGEGLHVADFLGF